MFFSKLGSTRFDLLVFVPEVFMFSRLASGSELLRNKKTLSDQSALKVRVSVPLSVSDYYTYTYACIFLTYLSVIIHFTVFFTPVSRTFHDGFLPLNVPTKMERSCTFSGFRGCPQETATNHDSNLLSATIFELNGNEPVKRN